MITRSAIALPEAPMTSRREVLKAGLAASAVLPFGARADGAVAIDVAPTETVTLYKVLYDARFAAGVAFGRRAAARGLPVQAMAGDMTRFWYDDLYHRWRQGPVAIAGLTAHGALFCLERLAWEQRMRVVYRGEHAAAPGGCVAHRFEGAAEHTSAAAASTANAAWSAALVDIVAECPSGRVQRSAARSFTVRATAAPRETLYSWVVAPVARA
jgi:hypothetical protein